MTVSCDDLIKRAYVYERRSKDQYFAAEPTETEEWYKEVHEHFENTLSYLEIKRHGDLFVEYWPVRFVSDREHTLRQGVTTSKLYNYEYGSHGTGYLCLTNRHVHLVVLKELTDRFPIHKPSLSGLLLDALSKQRTQLRPFQDDYTWTLLPADVRSVSIYQGRSRPERIKMETAAGVWEIYTHFHGHDDEIRRGLECFRSGAFSRLRPRFHMTRKPSILSDAELRQYQTKTDPNLIALAEPLDSTFSHTSESQRSLPHFQESHPAPNTPDSALISTIEVGEIHNPERYDSRLNFCWGPGGRSLITGGNDGVIRIWDLPTGVVQREVQAFEKRENHYSHNIMRCTLSPDQRILLTVSLGQGIQAWNTNTWDLCFHANANRQIDYCAFDLSGKYIGYSSYSSNAITILDAATGNPLPLRITFESLDFPGDGSIQSFKLAPSGKWILVHVVEENWERQRLVAVDIDSGEEMFAFKEFDTHGFDISPSGRYILTHRGPWADLNVWDAAQGTYTHEIKRSSHGPYNFSPSGKYVVSGLDDGRLVVYSLHSGEEVYTLTGHLAAIKDCQFSVDGRFLLSMDDRNSIKLWDLTKAKLHSSTPKYFLAANSSKDARRARSCQICDVNSLDQTVIVVSPAYHDAAILDSSTGNISERHTEFSGFQAAFHEEKLSQIQYFGVDCCDVGSDGKQILIANGDGWAIFDTINFNVIRHENLRHLPGHPSTCALSSNRRWVAVVFNDTLLIWDLETEQTKTVEAEVSIRSIVFDPGSQWLVYTTGSIMRKPEVKMYLLETGTIRTFDNSIVTSRRWPEGQPALTTWGPALDCDVTPDRSRIILAHAYDGTISTWSTDTLTLVHSWQAHGSLQNIGDSIACKSMPNSESVLTVASDGAVHLWEIQSGKCIASYYTDGKLYDCAVFPDGERIVAVGEAGVHWLKLKMPVNS